MTGWKRDVILTLDRWIYLFAKRWLVVFNVGMGLYVLLPILAPVLMVGGAPRIGRMLYIVYRPACHQLPERSFFLFGPRHLYSLEELRGAGLVAEGAGPVERQRFLGTPGIGFKAALCQRDLAMYGSMFVAGLAYGLWRLLFPRRPLRPLKLWVFGLLLLPMAFDGGTQLLLLRESNWVLRLITGTLTGVACVWLLYPYLDEAFDDLRRQANKRVHLEPGDDGRTVTRSGL
jgi:uncharacterized membrane protein